MKTGIAVLAALLITSTRALAVGVDLNVNADAARLTVDVPVPSNNLMLDVSWMHHQDNGDAASVAGHLTGSALSGASLDAGVGLRLSWVGRDKGEEEDGTALGIGGFLKYTLPRYDRIAIGGSAYYAPGVLSFGDVDDFYEVSAWAGYSVIPAADVYVGWRTMKADFEDDGRSTLDNGLHIGVRGRF
jgi:hypothetical protein